MNVIIFIVELIEPEEEDVILWSIDYSHDIYISTQQTSTVLLDPLFLRVYPWVLAADQVCMGAVSGSAGGVLVGAQPRAILCL